MVPSDLSVLLKLGQLYRTMGAEDAARQVFQIVLGQDPVNDAAAKLIIEGSNQC
jgi:TolA-binding protein